MLHGQQNITPRCCTVNRTQHRDAARSTEHNTEMLHGQQNIIPRCCTVNRTLNGVGWSTPRPGRFTPGKDPVAIVQEAGWAPEPYCYVKIPGLFVLWEWPVIQTSQKYSRKPRNFMALYQLMSLPSDVTVNLCHCQMVSLSSDVIVKWCHCQVMSLSNDVTVNLCHRQMMSLSSDVNVKWCHCQLMSLSNDVTVNLCHCQMLSLSSDVTLKWCHCQLMSLSNDVTVKWC